MAAVSSARPMQHLRRSWKATPPISKNSPPPLAIFLERFKTWRDYQDAANQDGITEEDARAALPEIAEIANALKDRPEIDPSIPAELEALAQDVRDAGDDPVTRTGMVAAFSNVMSAPSTKLLPVWRRCKTELADIRANTWELRKKAIAGAIVAAEGSIALVAFDVLFLKGTVLTSLATRFPAPWIGSCNSSRRSGSPDPFHCSPNIQSTAQPATPPPHATPPHPPSCGSAI